VNNAVAVALKVVAVSVRRLGIAASARLFYANGIIGQHAKSLAALIHRRDAEDAEKSFRGLTGPLG
jgi:hypothetical protein